MAQPAAARTGSVRRHNLALVLQQVHLEGVLSRAELTQRSGLSRSTIGGLVHELSELDLVTESVPVGGPRSGRPSHVVRPRQGGPYAVAVDIDVARVTTAAVGLGGTVLARHVVAVPGRVSPDALAGHVAAALPVLQRQVDGCPTDGCPTDGCPTDGRPADGCPTDGCPADGPARPVGIGISVPGTVDGRTGAIGPAPDLGWRDLALGPLVAAAVPSGLAVSVGNDADLAVLAEHRRGSARGCDDVVYLLGRSGVGAGILVDGRPLRGSGGLAGEVGHMVLHPAGRACHCGGRGCVETYVGEAALLRAEGQPTPGRPAPALAVEGVLRRAGDGDAAARRAVDGLAGHLGCVVATIVNLLNPRLVVMGGSLREVLLLAQPVVEAALDRHAMPGARAMVALRPSALGGDASLLGAAELAFGPLLADPLNCRRA